VISSVRNANDQYRKKLENYVGILESYGYSVHLPHRDTDQSLSGLEICKINREAIVKANEVHVFFGGSEGSLFDSGMVFMAEYFIGRKFKLIENIEYGDGKSFPRMMDEWNDN
jgi:hypothetical protein